MNKTAMITFRLYKKEKTAIVKYCKDRDIVLAQLLRRYIKEVLTK